MINEICFRLSNLFQNLIEGIIKKTFFIFFFYLYPLKPKSNGKGLDGFTGSHIPIPLRPNSNDKRVRSRPVKIQHDTINRQD